MTHSHTATASDLPSTESLCRLVALERTFNGVAQRKGGPDRHLKRRVRRRQHRRCNRVRLLQLGGRVLNVQHERAECEQDRTPFGGQQP